jgi:acetaldehyde dehydrogenase/alcohol dehydrogenase
VCQWTKFNRLGHPGAIYPAIQSMEVFMTVATLTELNDLVTRVDRAQRQFATYTQEQVDRIFSQAALAAAGERIPLAQLAVEETGMGVVEDKVIKNHFASEYIFNKYKDEKTCGVLRTYP